MNRQAKRRARNNAILFCAVSFFAIVFLVFFGMIQYTAYLQHFGL